MGRQGFLTRLVVHGPQVHFEGADQYTSYQLVVKDLRREGAVSLIALDFSLRRNLWTGSWHVEEDSEPWAWPSLFPEHSDLWVSSLRAAVRHVQRTSSSKKDFSCSLYRRTPNTSYCLKGCVVLCFEPKGTLEQPVLPHTHLCLLKRPILRRLEQIPPPPSSPSWSSKQKVFPFSP